MYIGFGARRIVQQVDQLCSFRYLVSKKRHGIGLQHLKRAFSESLVDNSLAFIFVTKINL